ncbi:major Facilitator Superfamily Transporter 16 isoform X2 [Leptinotarsa decemlineata]|uniref:major Facilitator Superfamily Transporter 16 isoform X2 n=1 Tax=Leptinotarsa decemlineata TaxID=7539 RepID=UPI000C2543F6|nr:glucose-6-phosphate exchanger SLC37A2 isoform X2 [Leptinotarsa decemlineata]
MVCDNGHTRIKTESSHPPIVLRRVNMSVLFSDVPWGIKVLQKLTDKCCPRFHINRELCYRSSIVFLTYIAYMCYHLSRKPISVVKAVLHRNCSDLTPETKDPNNSCDWAPFDGSDASASQMLGELDSSFLFCYAIAMFVSGFVAERVNLRYFLSLGMLMSGIFCYMFGLAKTYQIHSLWYYVLVQGLAGIFQTTGWPGVVTVMSNWFGKSKRGLIFGIWNSHTSIGNILGSLIAAQYVETDWALSFVMPGFYVGIVGFILFSFLVVNPADVGCATSNAGHEDRTRRYRPLDSQMINEDNSSGISSDVDDTDIIVGEQAIISRSRYLAEENLEVQRRVTERTTLLSNSSCGTPDKAIGFLKACCIPGVLEYSLALFFSKLVSYTFLYWLPLYVNASTTMGATLSADMSTLFDVGGIAGAIIAGVITDKSDMPASTCAFMLILAAPMMIIYERVSSVSLGLNMILLVIVGLLVNGPYALITTSVSAELGTHESLEGNSKALATVTAIIDGTGSIGAAVGPLLAGFVSNYGWKYVFLMLMISDVLALFLLIRLVKQEIYKFRNGRRSGIRLE